MLLQKITLLLAIILFSSCSTLFNKKKYPVYITSNEQHSTVKYKDSLYKLPTKIAVDRSKKDLEVTLITDSLSRDFNIKAVADPKFVYLNLIGNIFAPINYAVDLTNQKRFYYGKYIYLNTAELDNTIYTKPTKFERYITTRPSTKKGDINAYISLPFVNFLHFDFANTNAVRKDVGMLLFSTGIEYYHTDKDFLSIGIGSNSNLDYSAVNDKNYMLSHYVRIMNNHRINRFSFGYGIGFSHNIATKKYYLYSQMEDETIRIRNVQNTLDLIASANIELFKNVHLGLTYKPSVYRLSSPSDFAYNHVISAEITAKLRLNKKRNK